MRYLPSWALLLAPAVGSAPAAQSDRTSWVNALYGEPHQALADYPLQETR